MIRVFSFLALLLVTWPFPAAARSLTLAQAVELALRDNPQEAAAKARVQAATEGIKAARGAFGPSLGTSYTFTAADEPLSSTAGRQQSVWRVGLTQDLFSGFKNLASWQRAALARDHERENRRAVRLALVRDVQENYLEYLKARENIRSARGALERLRSQRQVTVAFFEEGLRPRLDLLQANVDVSRAEAALIQSENTAATQIARLNTLLRLPVESDTIYEGTLEPVPFSYGFAYCLERAHRLRPDLRMAALSVTMAGKDREIVRADYYPRVSATLNWSTRGKDLSAAGSSGQRTGYAASEIGIVAEWTLFDWGRTWYTDRQAGFVHIRLRAEEDNLRQEVAFEIKSRLLMARDAERRIEVARTAVIQAREAYHVALARYQAQIGTNTDVLDAQAKLTLEEASLTGAKADYLSALARLHAAMGEIHLDLTSNSVLPEPPEPHELDTFSRLN